MPHGGPKHRWEASNTRTHHGCRINVGWAHRSPHQQESPCLSRHDAMPPPSAMKLLRHRAGHVTSRQGRLAPPINLPRTAARRVLGEQWAPRPLAMTSCAAPPSARRRWRMLHVPIRDMPGAARAPHAKLSWRGWDKHAACSLSGRCPAIRHSTLLWNTVCQFNTASM